MTPSMLTSIDRSSPASTTAFCVMWETRITTVVVTICSAHADDASIRHIASAAMIFVTRLLTRDSSSTYSNRR